MHPRTLLLVAVAALVVLAGCSSAPDTSGTPAMDAQETGPAPATEAKAEATTDAADTATRDRAAETNRTEQTKATSLVTDPTEAAAAKTKAGAATDSCPPLLYLEAVERPGNETVYAYGNLSAERKAEFDTALVEGNAELDDSGYEFWVDRPYVEHGGDVYRAVVAVC